jgi:hypothetical protein
MKLGAITLGVGVSTTVNLTWVPQVIHFDVGTVPTSIKVNVLGEAGVILDLDGDGIKAASRRMRVGNLADQYVLILSDGMIKGKNVEITIINADAAGFNLYGFSEGYGSTYVQSLTQKVFANSGQTFKKFSCIAIPDLAATDQLTFNFRTGFSQLMAFEDVRMSASVDTYVDDTDSDFRINNDDASLSSINYIPAADTSVYVFRFLPVK